MIINNKLDKLKALLKDMESLAGAYYDESPILATESIKWTEQLREIIKEEESNELYCSRNDGLHNNLTY